MVTSVKSDTILHGGGKPYEGYAQFMPINDEEEKYDYMEDGVPQEMASLTGSTGFFEGDGGMGESKSREVADREDDYGKRRFEGIFSPDSHDTFLNEDNIPDPSKRIYADVMSDEASERRNEDLREIGKNKKEEKEIKATGKEREPPFAQAAQKRCNRGVKSQDVPSTKKANAACERPIFKDIRRYYCEYCGISRSKKSLLTSHILSHHQDEMKKQISEENGGKENRKTNICEECGAIFQKPAHLKQHMLSHSLERPFTCPVDDCHSSYSRKDHLARHLLKHQGKLFNCHIEECNCKFAYQGNLTRHMKEFHENSAIRDTKCQKHHVCPEVGCGKVFKYASKLRKHEDSHVKLDTVETICSECMKHFTNERCLKAHVQSCHQHIICEICGTKQLKKNMKRHLQTHEPRCSPERIKCSFKGCLCSFSTKSNLNQHIKAVHSELKPFACSIPGCGMRFSFKHVRDNHEKSGSHVYIHGDFEVSDEVFQSRPRGGRKRKCPGIETLLMRKRVIPPGGSDSVSSQGPEYLSWLLSTETGNQP